MLLTNGQFEVARLNGALQKPMQHGRPQCLYITAAALLGCLPESPVLTPGHEETDWHHTLIRVSLGLFEGKEV